MKKQKVQLLVLFLLLVLSAAAYLGVRYYNRLQAEKPVEIQGNMVIDVAVDDVVRLSYDYEGEVCSFEKEDDTWYVAGDHSLNLKPNRITAMVSGIAPLTAEQVIENVTDLEQYGLEEPQRTITFSTERESYTIYVGDQNTITNNYYITMPDSSTVYMVALTTVNRFNMSMEDLVVVEEASEN